MTNAPKLSRRAFIKGAAGGFAVAGVASIMDVRPVQARTLRLKIEGTKEYPSVCPYCAVGCGTIISVKDNKIINIEGNPDSPINNGTLCPKGAASFQLAVNPLRSTKTLYRRPGGTQWEEIELEKAMDMVAERVRDTREATWQDTFKVKNADGTEVEKKVNRTMGIFSLGGATMDNEWNYAQLKLLRGLGVVAIENQARI
jgi:formate dehydrogenase major subunit